MRVFKNLTVKALVYSAAIFALSAPVTLNAYAKDDISTTAQTSQKVSQTIASGEFSGRSDHVTKGKVDIIKTVNGYQLILGTDFFLDKAPDPIVALGNGDKFVLENKISGLKNKRGEQVYNLPASLIPAQFSQAYIWCERFDLPLGIADLNFN